MTLPNLSFRGVRTRTDAMVRVADWYCSAAEANADHIREGMLRDGLSADAIAQALEWLAEKWSEEWPGFARSVAAEIDVVVSAVPPVEH